MHTAFDCSPLLHGYRDKPQSILVHGAKLFIGSSTGTLSVYRIDDPTPPPAKATATAAGDTQTASSSLAASSSKPRSPPSQPTQVSTAFSRRSIDQLGIIKETNTLVSLSDASISLHDLSTLGPQHHLTQTKGALAFSIDTSIQKQVPAKLPDYGPGPLGGIASLRGSRFAPPPTNSAYRPGAAVDASASGASGTASRSRPGQPGSPSRWQSASLRGMDALVKLKEEDRRRALEGARLGGGAGNGAADANDGVMTLVTVLAVGLKRKVIFFRWVDGEFWDTREIPLAHTPRHLAFPSPTRLFMGYNASEFGVLSIPLASESTVAFTHPSAQGSKGAGVRREVHAQPPTNSTSGPLVDLTAQDADAWGFSDFDLPSSADASTGSHATSAVGGLGAAFGGLGGYIGMAGRGKSTVLQMDGDEVLVTRDNVGVFFGADGKPSRRDGLEWPAVPDEVAFAKPYLFAVLPGGSVASLKQSQAPNANYPVLQVRSASTLIAVQSLCFPPLQLQQQQAGGGAVWTTPPSVRLLTTSASSKPPIYVVVTPNDRGALEREGSTVWRLDMQAWGRQVDELVQKGEFEEALALLDSVDEVIFEDKLERRALVQGLHGVYLFSQNKFDEAVEIFTELDMNPAKVLALYPSNVAGDLARGPDEWLPIFGGSNVAKDAKLEAVTQAAGTASLSSSPAARGGSTSMAQPTPRTKLSALLTGIRTQSIVGGEGPGPSSSPGRNPAPAPSPSRDPRTRSHLAPDVDNSDAASIRSVRSTRDARPGQQRSKDGPLGPDEIRRRSLDALGRFLADRRRIFKPILESLPQLESRDHMTMSQIKRDSNWLLSLPNRPLGTLEKDELMAVAQTVDTALFKTFLETKPALVGPLCRVENWCEVEQVEELLKERRKYSELIALYGGKEMHGKALKLLRQFSEDEDDDDEEKVGPTIRYLQNLGPEFVETILEASHWVLRTDARLGMEIFTADAGKVAQLPRAAIVADLEAFDESLCARYLEHIIGVLDERNPELHDKLVRLYLGAAQRASEDKERTSNERKQARTEVMSKLLAFLRSSTRYRPELILGRLPAEEDDRDMFEARALLLGRMGQHEGALRIYVRKLNDLERAETYCRDVWTARRRIEDEKRLRHAEAGYLPPSRPQQPQQQQQQRTTQREEQDDESSEGQDGNMSEEQRKKADLDVFLTLLQVFLRVGEGGKSGSGAANSKPGDKGGRSTGATGGGVQQQTEETPQQLDAALSLIQRNASRIDVIRTLELLPPLVPLRSLEDFVRLSLRDQTRRENEAKVLRHVGVMRDLQVDERLCRLQSQRVKVGESRTCPRCHKRLGNAVVAVEPLSGAVLHYFCMIHGDEPALALVASQRGGVGLGGPGSGSGQGQGQQGQQRFL